jgi:hypothetical protein
LEANAKPSADCIEVEFFEDFEMLEMFDIIDICDKSRDWKFVLDAVIDE